MSGASARIIAMAEASTTVTDAQGRVLTLRQLGVLDRLRLFKTLGGTLANNAAYLGMATLAYMVIAIDGVPVPAPVTEQQLESLVSRLGTAGLSAAAAVLAQADAARAAVTEDAAGN